MTKDSSSTIWIVSSLALVVGLAAAGVLYFFDPNSHSFYPTCLFHQMTGLLCPGCGSLRAMHQLLHGHIATAFRFNPLLMLGLPFGAGFALLSWMGARTGRPLNFPQSAKCLWIYLALGLAFTVWRNIPGTLFATLPH